ncbi:MAG TPA: MFS transporter [Candidatus Limnocylindria bacterium]|nr:MFS transporter [Candidatus Limnocylindria bacterium]
MGRPSGRTDTVPLVRTILLGATLALTLLPSNVPAAAIPLLAAEWDASNAALGWVVGAHLFGYSLAVLVVLPLTDRFGPRPIVVIGATLAGVASLALPLVGRDVTAAVLTRLAAGAGLAGVYMPGVRIIAATVEARRRGAAVGAFVAAFYLGSSLSFLYAGLVIGPNAGWRDAATSSALLALLAPVLALPASRGVAAARGRAVLDPAVLRDAPLVRTIVAYSGHAWELFAVRGWLAAFLAAALVAQGASSVGATAEAGRWSALILGAGIPAVFLGAWISDRLGRTRTAIAFGLASGAVGLVYGALSGIAWPLLIAIGFAWSALIAADSAVYSTRVTELAPPARVGSAQAIQAFSGFAMGAVGPVVAGIALDAGLGFVGAFAVASVASLIGCLPLVADLRR